jgi:hypothetical protein
MPVQGRDADPGPAGDLPEGRVGPLLRERRPGCGQQMIVVAPAVSAGGNADVPRAYLIHHGPFRTRLLLIEALLRIIEALLRFHPGAYSRIPRASEVMC